MKRWIPGLLLLLMGAFALAQETPPAGTKPSPNEPNAVRPQKKVRSGNKMKTAPSNVGRGAKAAGHDVKEGHPIEAGKAVGEGTGHAGKDVGQGTASAASEGAHRTKEGGKDVGGGAKDAAQDVGHGAKEGAKKVGHGVKKGVKKITGKDNKKPGEQ